MARAIIPGGAPTIFGLDYDGTVTRDLETWLKVIAVWRACGHTVYLVTMRWPDERDHPVETAMDARALAAVDAVHFTSHQAKRSYMQALGIEVHVWIDDHPEAVTLSADEVWPDKPSRRLV